VDGGGAVPAGAAVTVDVERAGAVLTVDAGRAGAVLRVGVELAPTAAGNEVPDPVSARLPGRDDPGRTNATTAPATATAPSSASR
jgi:hypothetical protein